MNIVALWLRVMKSCQKSCKIVKKCAKVIKSVQQWQNMRKKLWKWANINWTRFYKELLSQLFEVLQMWPRHTARLWDCHSFYGFHAIYMAFQWNSMASRWNAMEFHGIQKITIVSMVSTLFPWHFSGIILHPGGMLWNAMETYVWIYIF